jgi:tetratricopeptide (TPR) repeat protein
MLDTVVADAERWEWLDLAADAHFLRGEVADRDGKPRDAADGYARAYAASRRQGDPRRGVRDLNALTNALLDAGAYDKAAEVADEAGRLAGQAQELGAEATAHNNLGEARRLAGRLDEARMAYERALALARRADDPTAVASILLNLGALERRAGRLAQARAHFVEARDLARRLDDRRASEYAQRSLEQLEGALPGAGSAR